ncbi:hypothetical protein [Hydrogenophaga luteola]|uniref:Uncharacterized protein n=1 Tax=Hydrogenophaga luteola TaxID=1591122 RepID=A0ABV7W9N9_9BURK
MDSLKLGLVGLSAAEESLVQTLFRLHKVDPSFIWTLATSSPFDALLVDAGCDPLSYQTLRGSGTAVKVLGRLNDDAEGVMPRPIRSDLLVHWLNSIEVGILHGGHDQFASTAGQQQSQGAGGGWRASRLHGKVSSLLGIEAGDAMDPFIAGDCLFKLKRWPPPELLLGDVNRIRIATLLSRKHLSLKDLASLSRVPADKCSIFVRTLFKEQLLESKPVSVAAKSAVPDAAAAVTMTSPYAAEEQDSSSAPATPPRTRGLGSSLIASIRKRFGIL